MARSVVAGVVRSEWPTVVSILGALAAALLA
jgi:hypothetical protein